MCAAVEPEREHCSDNDDDVFHTYFMVLVWLSCGVVPDDATSGFFCDDAFKSSQEAVACGVACKAGPKRAAKPDTGVERAMEEKDGAFALGRRGEEDGGIAVGMDAAGDDGARRLLEAQALGGDGDATVRVDTCLGACAPDVRPPRTSRSGPQDGAFFGEGLGLGRLGGGAQFAVDFVLVGVDQELVEQPVGAFEFVDVIGGQERREAFLPVIMAALDFAFGLGRWGIEQFDAVEVKRLAEPSEGIGVVGVEEGVEVDIEGQWQTVVFEDAGQEIKMGQQGFGGIEARSDIEACGIIQDVEEGLFVGFAGQPGMRAGVVLPERAQIPGLPAFDGFGGGFVAGVGGELVLDGPTPDAGTVGFEVEPAMEFAGTGAVRRWRF